jgi:sucrose-6-phosphate hydrolase SacC (GH32 family)
MLTSESGTGAPVDSQVPTSARRFARRSSLVHPRQGKIPAIKRALAGFAAWALLGAAASAAPDLVHRWSFNDGTANDSISTAHGTLFGDTLPAITGGRLVLNPGSDQNQYIKTSAFTGETLGTRTLVAWVTLSNLNQPGGAGVLGIHPAGVDNFDSIVYGERVAKQWMNGSSSFSRTVANNGGAAETSTDEVMMAIVYDSDNSIKLYRNGVRYDTNANMGTLVTRTDPIAILGRRQEGTAPELQGAINEARIYNYALTDVEIQNLHTLGPDTLPGETGVFFNITASAGTGGAISPAGVGAVAESSTPTYTITPAIGYDVAAVVLDAGTGSESHLGSVMTYTFAAVTAAHTIDASFVAVFPHTITASAGTNGSISPTGAVSVDHRGSQDFTITPNTGYAVADVVLDAGTGSETHLGSVTTYTFAPVTAAHTISASFVAVTPRGHWTFEPGAELVDLTGHFPDLVLMGNATVSNGALDINGAGTSASGWAHSGSGGTALGSKTLISWVTLQGLSAVANSGSPISLETPDGSTFDGIVFAEKSANRWMNGSDYWRRSPDGQFDAAAAQESATGSIIQMAVTYQNLGGGQVRVTGYRNGVRIGTYQSGNMATWEAGNQVVLFGPRERTNSAVNGALDALVHEARLYDTALTQAQIQTLTMVSTAGAATLDVPADYSNPNVVADLAGGNPATHFNLLGDATFGSSTGPLLGNITINQAAFTLTLDTGVNPTVLLGALTGSGAFALNGSGTATDALLDGTAANTLTGIHTISMGTLALSKTAGTTAIAGNIVVGGGNARAVLRWDASHQVADGAGFTLRGPQLAVLDFNGCDETAGALRLLGNSELHLGAGSAVVRFAASATEPWTSDKTLVIREWDGAPGGGGTKRVVFGSSPGGLTTAQVAQLGFVNPLGFAAGTYPAKILATGEVVPDGTPQAYPYETPVRPANPPANWLTYHLAHPGPGGAFPGDPNCAFYWKGRYHLHYIYNNQVGFSFAHVSSADMVHWQWHPTTLTPPVTGHGMFSGTGFITKDGRPAIIYHGQGSDRNQLAFALDDQLEQWTKPVAIIPKEPSGQESTVRQWDPDCWLNGNTYYGISGGGPPHLMKSADLNEWVNLGELMHPNMPTTLGVSRDEDVSCANMFKLGNKWMLLCISHNLGCRYYLGDFQDEKFLPDFHAMMNWRGWEFFAPESLLTPDGRRVMWAWCKLDGNPQSGVQSLPRELSLPADGVLRIKPLRELEQLRQNEKFETNLSLSNNDTHVLNEIAGDAVELRVRFQPSTATEFGVEVYCDASGNNGFPITVNPGAGTLRLGTMNVPFAPGIGQAVELRIFIDKNMIEVFANERQAAVAPCSYWSANLGIRLFSHGGAVQVPEVRGWQMRSAYEQVPLATTFDTWATFTKGLAGPAAAFDADPDQDGIPNGIEFLIGGEPNPANPGSNSCALLPTATGSGDHWVFTYRRTHEAAFLNPVVEFGTDLQGSWTSAADPLNSTIAVTPGPTEDTLTVTIPKAGNVRMFARLRVTQP